ncbi:MAG TPA: alpha-ketoglutarate-dependent dioxygenase AlkB [Kofleriaceae bacterium]|jgi:alkylated DNA repair dioxygenase AlkB
MRRQLDLLSATPIGFDATFSQLRRAELSDGAWMDHAPAWVSGHDRLFDELEAQLSWHTETRRMYDQVVATPRLLATIPAAEVCGGIIEDMRRVLSAHYGEDFVRTTAALYRDGHDSVAFHGDTTARDMAQAVVATVSLGQPRRFLLRRATGGPSITYQLGRGDLVVMGGTCQRTWRHAIPKVAHAPGPRIAVMFRPAWGDG